MKKNFSLFLFLVLSAMSAVQESNLDNEINQVKTEITDLINQVNELKFDDEDSFVTFDIPPIFKSSSDSSEVYYDYDDFLKKNHPLKKKFKFRVSFCFAKDRAPFSLWFTFKSEIEKSTFTIKKFKYFFNKLKENHRKIGLPNPNLGEEEMFMAGNKCEDNTPILQLAIKNKTNIFTYSKDAFVIYVNRYPYLIFKNKPLEDAIYLTPSIPAAYEDSIQKSKTLPNYKLTCKVPLLEDIVLAKGGKAFFLTDKKAPEKILNLIKKEGNRFVYLNDSSSKHYFILTSNNSIYESALTLDNSLDDFKMKLCKINSSFKEGVDLYLEGKKVTQGTLRNFKRAIDRDNFILFTSKKI